MNGVEFRQVSFGHARHTPILDGFTLAVDAGEVVALVGASGAGKTTALKLVNRLLVPDAGEVSVQGKDTSEWDPIRLRRAIGYVIQDVGLFPHLTVADNIAVVPRLEGWEESRVRRPGTRAARADRARGPTPTPRGGRMSCQADNASVSVSRARSPRIRPCC